MNVKPWLLWTGLLVLFASLALLFRANQLAGAAQNDASGAHQQIEKLQLELDELKSSSVASLQTENARLRSENQGYSQRLAKANNDLTQLEAARQKLAGQLHTARQALQMQQDHLQQLTLQNQQVQAAAAAAPVEASPEDGKETCLQNLRAIDAAKQLWALDLKKDVNDTPTAADIAPYLKSHALPVCPSGGSYTIGAMNQAPACSVTGHDLP